MTNKATPKQKKLFAQAVELGCLPCRLDDTHGTPAQISHAHDYGYRNHDIFYPCCPVHHMEQHAINGIPNRHKNPIEFREKYGTDLELHQKTMMLLGVVDYKNIPF